MLAYIKGTLEMKMTGYIVIDVGGLGYKVFMSESGIEKLGNIGETVKVHTFYKVREDDISIFGFNTLEELRMFELLISVSGVGAKTAITMLDVCEPTEFALAIISEDIKTLTQIPGIGAKSAQRIILELKDKIKKEQQIQELTKVSKGISGTKTKLEQRLEQGQKIMENAKSKKERRLIKIMVVAWIIAATLGGCVVSLNIQKNNQNSTQSVSQENEATQKNDSTNFNMNTKNGKEQ